MSAILRNRLQDNRSDVITTPLSKRPVIISLPTHFANSNIATGISWEELINTPCNRDPTVELEVAIEHQAPVSLLQWLPTVTQSPGTIEIKSVHVETKPGTPVASPRSLDPDTVLLCGRYQVKQAIATGGSATIYGAKDLRRVGIASSSPFIAIKMLKPEFRKQAKDIEGLKREYAYTLQLSHPNIVRVLDLNYDEHCGWFITMELLDGGSLAAILHGRYHTALQPQQALSIIAICGRALLYAHTQGVLHCDFKPGNVQVTKAGRVCLLDFGAAGKKLQRATATTPAYASPQLLAGDRVDERDDLFSLGCTAYELLTGQHPFGGLSACEVSTQKPVLKRPSQLSSRRWCALKKSLSLDREQRQASIAIFLQELDAVSMPRVRRYSLWLIAVTAALILCAFATTIIN